jgi:hypothetical protein
MGGHDVVTEERTRRIDPERPGAISAQRVIEDTGCAAFR